MNHFTRFNLRPVSAFPLDAALDNFFQGLAGTIQKLEEPQPVRQIRIDVVENDVAYTVHAEIPGVEKDAIQVTIDGSQVTINVETTKHTEEKEAEKLLRSERYFGRAARSFTLAQEVDEEGAEAKYHAGVLELKLPKKAIASAKKLTIQ